ncbi:MAG: septum formation initiator family protein [Candidatus Metalachnospira sp.]|nr:septum formation initiator family protein [Candidatus Metalachnospira sp.]
MAKTNKKTSQKAKRSSTTKFVGIILTVFSVFVAVNLVLQLNTYAQLKSEKETIENRIEEENKKKEDYNNQMEYYSTDEYIEKIAREQLGLVMPDEIVFKINND